MKRFGDTLTNPDESKQLTELGLPVESADFYIVDYYIGGKGYNVYGELHVPFVQYERKMRKMIWKVNVGKVPEPIPNGALPCWSYGRLIEIINICYYKKQFRMEFCQDDEHSLLDNVILCIKNASTLKQIDFSKLKDYV